MLGHLFCCIYEEFRELTAYCIVVNPEDEVYKGGLPIKPKVTPGMAVAGVALLLTGVPYCLIGIKIKLYVFPKEKKKREYMVVLTKMKNIVYKYSYRRFSYLDSASRS